jgi:hypothetical protein
MGLNVLGGVANIVGAVGQKNEAKRQMEAQKGFGERQRGAFKSGYTDLISQAKGLSTYQGDLTKYNQAEALARQNQMQAAGTTRVAGEQFARENASRATANMLAQARKTGGSSSNLLTAALLGQQQESEAQGDISARSQQQIFNQQNLAQQQYLNQLGVSAGAAAQQAGLEFQSKSQKENQLLGLTESQFKEGMNLEDQLFGQEQAKAAAFQNAKSAIWSGIGGIASGIGGGLMNMQQGAEQMNLMKSIYGGNSLGAYQGGTIQQRMGTPTPMQLPTTFGQQVNLRGTAGFGGMVAPTFAPRESPFGYNY